MGLTDFAHFMVVTAQIIPLNKPVFVSVLTYGHESWVMTGGILS